jgi:RNA 3'-terminal phosphate cyclase (GTP)
MLEIDGSHGEGGGQIVRTALALSTLTGTPIRINNIRKGRSQPGLKHQHLKSILALKELCSAETNELNLGDEELIYKPGKLRVKDLEVDIVTSGAIALFLQPLILPLCFGNKSCTLKIKGGTCGKGAMSMEYFVEILQPHLQKFCKIETKIKKRGYYPRGGGEVEITFYPKHRLNKFESFEIFLEFIREKIPNIYLINPGKLSHVFGISHASTNLQEKNVAERQAHSAEFNLKSLKTPVKINSEYSLTLSPGTGMTLCAIFASKDEIDENNPIRIGASSLGKLRKTSEQVGKEVALTLKKELDLVSKGACVDTHLEDNLILWLIFGGKFKTHHLTPHTITNIWVVNQFFPNLIKVENNLIYTD